MGLTLKDLRRTNFKRGKSLKSRHPVNGNVIFFSRQGREARRGERKERREAEDEEKGESLDVGEGGNGVEAEDLEVPEK